jgi:pyrroline-5-carboxylate reductase
MMKEQRVGFVGGGRVVRIFLEGWRLAQKMPAKVVVSDCNAEPLVKLKARFPEIEVALGGNGLSTAQDIVFLAVHPPAMAEVATSIRGRLEADAIIVSLAPKVTMARLSELLGGFSRVARVIPNAPSVVDSGFNPVSFGPALAPEDRARLTSLLEPLGDCPEVAEAKLEAYALLTGMGPTYLWFQLQALRELAASFGLSEGETTIALKRMVCGTARTLLESDLPPAEVMDLVPVKPLAEIEAHVTEAYRTKLSGLYQKLKP